MKGISVYMCIGKEMSLSLSLSIKKKIYMHYICKPTCVYLFLMFLCASLCRGEVLEYESSHLDYALRKYGDASFNTAPNA